MQILYLRWDSTNASFIFGIMVLFSIKNSYLFLNCIPSDLKTLSSLWFDMRSICFCAITCTVTEVASVIVYASNKELQREREREKERERERERESVCVCVCVW